MGARACKHAVRLGGHVSLQPHNINFSVRSRVGNTSAARLAVHTPDRPLPTPAQPTDIIVTVALLA